MSEEEMKALVEMNNMLKVENAKLKQEKEEHFYKNAWKELKTKTGQFDVMQNGFGGCCIYNDLDDLMQELERKHGIEVE